MTTGTTGVDAVRRAISAASVGLFGRDALVEVLFLAAVAGEHVLVVGPPGTGKSQAVRNVAEQLGGSYFEYLLGRFTEPNEIFGPVDLRKLRDGVVEIETSGMLPEADVAFLDEIFLGSTAIINTLLGILNEGVFRRGRTVTRVPLRLCVAASNEIPTDPSLAAFADRFVIRVFVEPIGDEHLEELLVAAATEQSTANPPALQLDQLDHLRALRRTCDVAPVRAMLARAIRQLREAGVPITDRRAVKAQSLISAAAVLDGRTAVAPNDLWPLPLIASTDAAQVVAREVLSPLLDEASNYVMPNAAELLSASAASRAQRLIESGREMVMAPPNQPASALQLRREAWLRELDASFSPDHLRPELVALRERMVELVQL